MTKLNRTALKQMGISLLAELKVPSVVLHVFDKTDTVHLFGSCLFDGKFMFCNVEPVTPNSELSRRIAVAEKNGAKVFAITRDYLPDYGVFYSFLLVSPYEEDWDVTFKALGDNTYRVYAYVWNVNDDKCSEFGSVYIKAENGGLRRVG